MPWLTEKQKKDIDELKGKGLGASAVGKALKIPKRRVEKYYYRELIKGYNREFWRKKAKVKNPMRYEFIRFVKDYDAGKDVTISYTNYCAQMLLHLSEFLKFGRRRKDIRREIGRNVQYDVRWMLRKKILNFDSKRYVLTEKGIDVCGQIV